MIIPRIDSAFFLVLCHDAVIKNFNIEFSFSLHIIRSEEIFIYLFFFFALLCFRLQQEKIYYIVVWNAPAQLPSVVNGAGKICADNEKLEKQSSSSRWHWIAPLRSIRIMFDSRHHQRRLCRRPSFYISIVFTFHFVPTMAWKARRSISATARQPFHR